MKLSTPWSLSALIVTVAAGSTLAAPATRPAAKPTKPTAKPAARSTAKPAAVKLPAGVVATVNGHPINQAEVTDRMWREAGQAEVDREVNKEIVRLEAKKRGLTATPAEVQKEMDSQRQRFITSPGRTPADWDQFVKRYSKKNLMDDMQITVLANKIGEDEAKKTKLTPEEIKQADESVEREANQVHARHILVGVGPQFGNRTDADALKRIQEAQDALAKGTKWEDVAKTYSDDTSNKDRGGDLGFFTRGQMVKEFEDAAFSLKPNEITPKPVKTQFGYHLIQVLEVKNTPVTAAEKKKAEDDMLARKKEAAKSPNTWFQTLRTKYKIVSRLPFE